MERFRRKEFSETPTHNLPRNEEKDGGSQSGAAAKLELRAVAAHPRVPNMDIAPFCGLAGISQQQQRSSRETTQQRSCSPADEVGTDQAAVQAADSDTVEDEQEERSGDGDRPVVHWGRAPFSSMPVDVAKAESAGLDEKSIEMSVARKDDLSKSPVPMSPRRKPVDQSGGGTFSKGDSVLRCQSEFQSEGRETEKLVSPSAAASGTEQFLNLQAKKFPPAEKFRNLPAEQFRSSPTNQFRNSPTEQFRNAPTEQFRNSPTEQFANPPAEQFGNLPTIKPEQHRQLRNPPAEQMRNSPAEQCRNPSVEKFITPPVDQFRNLPAEQFTNTTAEQFRNPSAEQCRNPPSEQFINPPAEQLRTSPGDPFRNLLAEQFTNPTAEQFRNPPAEQFRNPPAEQCRNSPADPFRNLPAEQFTNPTAEQFRNLIADQPEHFQLSRNPPAEQFRNFTEGQFRNPQAEQFRNLPAEQFRHPSSEQFRNPPAEHFRNLPAEHIRNPPAEQFRNLRVAQPEQYKPLRNPSAEKQVINSPGDDFRNPPGAQPEQCHPPAQSRDVPAAQHDQCHPYAQSEIRKVNMPSESQVVWEILPEDRNALRSSESPLVNDAPCESPHDLLHPAPPLPQHPFPVNMPSSPYPPLIGILPIQAMEQLKAGWPYVYPGYHHLAAADGRILAAADGRLLAAADGRLLAAADGRLLAAGGGGGGGGQFIPVGGGVPLGCVPIGGGGQFGPFSGLVNFGRAPSPPAPPGGGGLVNFGRVQSPPGPSGPAPSFYIPLDPRLHQQLLGMDTVFLLIYINSTGQVLYYLTWYR